METMKVGDVTLAYEYYTHFESKGTIVFLNGVMASYSSWKPYTDYYYNRGYNVLVHDFRGQLMSEKPNGPYSFKVHSEDTFALMDALDITNAHLIGTSYGGEVAMKMAILDGARINSMIIINAVSELDETLTYKVRQWKTLAQSHDAVTFMEGMMGDIYSQWFIEENRAMINKRIEAMQTLDSSYFEGQIVLYDTFLNDVTMTQELKGVTIPTLVVSSEHDTLKPYKFSQIIHHALQESEHVMIPGCAHVTIFEAPKTLMSVMTGFLEK